MEGVATAVLVEVAGVVGVVFVLQELNTTTNIDRL
jgi:hypothetical protein